MVTSGFEDLTTPSGVAAANAQTVCRTELTIPATQSRCVERARVPCAAERCGATKLCNRAAQRPAFPASPVPLFPSAIYHLLAYFSLII